MSEHYVVMGLWPWSNLELMEETTQTIVPVVLKDSGSLVGFLPVFANLDDAKEYAGDKYEVVEIRLKVEEATP